MNEEAVRHDSGGSESESPTRESDAPTRSVWGDIVGVAFTVVCAALVLLPVLRPGVSLGPFDILTRFGLTSRPGVTVHNAIQGDQIQQFVPWTDFAWHQIHSGQLPLWNPYSGLGLPFAFNWQSAIFSLPMLIGYLVPVHMAYAAVVLAKLVIAGTGAYTLCRVLRLGPLSSALGGTTFELSGPIIVHSGWSMVGVTCWSGWVFAALVLLLRGRHRLRAAVLLAVSVAFAIYGGHPESLIVLTLTTATFVVFCVVLEARAAGRTPWRRLLDIAGAGACGLGLAAPLLLPGVQLGASSSRSAAKGAPAFALSHLPNLLSGGLQGLDFRNSAYVGVIVVALAVVGIKAYWPRPEVIALVAVGAVCMLLTFFSPADLILYLLPGGRTVAWSRSVMILPLVLGVLAAMGAQALASASEERKRTLVSWAAVTLAAEGLVVAGVFLAALLDLSAVAAQHKGTVAWPAAEVIVGLGAVAMVRWSEVVHARVGIAARNVGRDVVAVLLIVNTAFLVFSGVSFWSESSSFFAPTPAVRALQADVGSGLVGYGSCVHIAKLTPSGAEVGIKPEVNMVYGVREMVVYDPIIPASYFKAWKLIAHQTSPPALRGLGIFCASIESVQQAQLLGISDILEPPATDGPEGTRLVGRVGNELLFSVPGAAEATLSPPSAAADALVSDSPGTPVPVSHPNAATWRMVTNATSPEVLQLRLTDVPGWNATIDGQPLRLRPWAHGLMLEANIKAGTHTIELQYWPTAFTAGIAVACAVAAGLILSTVAVAFGGNIKRRRSRPAP